MKPVGTEIDSVSVLLRETLDDDLDVFPANMQRKVYDKQPKDVIAESFAAVRRHKVSSRKLPQELYKSLTWDRGTEMAAHKRFTLATDIKVYSVILTTLGTWDE